ncbi:PD40 domain-containing protein [soil metagenome]
MTIRNDHRSRGRRIALIAGLAGLAVAVVAPGAYAATPNTKRVSIHSNGSQATGRSSEPSVSGNGRFVAFQSEADNLVAGDGNTAWDIFVRDNGSKTTTLVSRHSNGTQGNGVSEDAAISADGRWVAFESGATNLVNADANGTTEDVFLHDRKTRKTTLVSVHSNGTQGDLNSTDPSVSANGRYVAFESNATNLVNGDTNGSKDVFVHDRKTGKTFLVSRRPNGANGNGDSQLPSISASGRFVAFHSVASNLVKGDTNGRRDVFVHDRSTNATQRVSLRSNGKQGNDDSEEPSISANGRWVVFWSDASNLVAKDSNGAQDVFLRDRQTKKTILISRRGNGASGNGESDDGRISGDGRWVVFESDASNLVKNDTNGTQDIFRRGPMR